MRIAVLLTSVALFFPSLAEARVFDFKNEKLAIFFGANVGNSFLGDGAYALAAGPDVHHTAKAHTSRAFEVGAQLTLGHFNLRLGADYLLPTDHLGVHGKNANDVTLFSVDSKLSAYSWTGNLEVIFFRQPQSRALIGVGYGTATAHLSNHYLVTTDGTAAFGVGSYREEGTGTGTMFQGYIGWETLLADVSTALVQVGYRDLHIGEFKSTRTASSISGNQSDGSSLLNRDGSKRAVNLGGLFVGINFRFYL